MNDLMNLPKKVIPFKDYSKKTKSVKKGAKGIENRRPSSGTILSEE